MFLSFQKINLFFFLLFFLFLFFCSPQYNQNSLKKSSNNTTNNESIDINSLMLNLLAADKKLTPKLIYNTDGSSFYSYTKKPGEGKITLKEIKKRISLGSDFYEIDRENIRTLLGRINELKINNKLDNIESGALGLWIPYKDY